VLVNVGARAGEGTIVESMAKTHVGGHAADMSQVVRPPIAADGREILPEGAGWQRPGHAGNQTRWTRWVLRFTVIMGVAFGAMQRAWLLTHMPIFGDESVVGLIAQDIAHGHVTTFYWGQAYGGVEPYLVAAVTAIVHGPLGLNGTSSILSGLAAVVVGRLVFEISGSREAGLLAGVLAWVWPYVLIWNSTRELGFHFTAMFLGVSLVYLAVRISRGHSGAVTCLAFGACAGVGWWSSPEIAYFAIPALTILVTTWFWRDSSDGSSLGLPQALLVVGGAVVGALPWIYSNAHSGFASITALPDGVPSTASSRLGTFFSHVLPLEAGLRALWTGRWLGGAVVGPVLYGLMLTILVASLVYAFVGLRHGRLGIPLAGIAMGLLTFPMIFIHNPGATYWLDGRYGVDFGMLAIPLVFSTAAALAANGSKRAARSLHASRHARRDRGRRHIVGAGAAAVVLGCLVTGVGAQPALTIPRPGLGAFASGWTGVNSTQREAARKLESAGIHYAYASYWVAYNLDYLEPTILVSPSPLDAVRSVRIAGLVAGSSQQAWLFSAPSQAEAARFAFGGEQGPGGYSESEFLAYLDARGVSARVVHAGILDAVLPATPVDLPTLTSEKGDSRFRSVLALQR
jgi:hypothetical protein